MRNEFAPEFNIGDRVRHIGGTVEGIVKQFPSTNPKGVIFVEWADFSGDYWCATRIDSLEYAPLKPKELVLEVGQVWIDNGNGVRRHITGFIKGGSIVEYEMAFKYSIGVDSFKAYAKKVYEGNKLVSASNFFVKDRVRHIGGTVEGTVVGWSLGDNDMLVLVEWDDYVGRGCTTRDDSLELVPVPVPTQVISPWGNEHPKMPTCDKVGCKPAPENCKIIGAELALSPTPPEASPQEAEMAMGMVPYREWSACLNTAKIDASDSFKVKSIINYAREISATAPFASLIFDLANFLEDATKDNPCTGAFCTFDPRESCEFCGKSNDEHAKAFHAGEAMSVGIRVPMYPLDCERVANYQREQAMSEFSEEPAKPKPHPWDKQRDKIECGDRITLAGDTVCSGGRYLATNDGDPILVGTYTRVERIGSNGWEDVNVD